MHYHKGILVNDIRKQGDRVISTCTITPLQIEIGKLLAEGLDEKSIAQKLKKSNYTIKNHKMYAFEKTDSKSSAQYVYKLVKAGLIALAMIFSSSAFTQCVEVDRFTTAGFYYLHGSKASGFQFEIGSTGSEQNFSYYAILSAYNTNGKIKYSEAAMFPNMAFGLKAAYRFVRVENIFNAYITTAVGQDIELGWYNANSIKILTSLGGRIALSIEPSYLLRQKAVVTQVGINVILDR